MTSLEALLDLCKRTINDSNDWYSWRKINEKKLPSGITLPRGNHYEQNVYLKTALRKKIKGTKKIKVRDKEIK